MPDMRYAAGMDGGGTKTVLEARAPDGRVLLRERFGPLNLNSAASQAVRETMQGCTDALARLPGGLEACAALCVGSAGVSNPQARALLEQMLRRCGYRGALLLTGDQETALAGALGAPCGMVLIAGTGSICFGRDAAGKTARSGGYGHKIDDEGSGYALGRDALAAVVRAQDGRGPRTLLTDLVFAQLKVVDVGGLVQLLMTRKQTKNRSRRWLRWLPGRMKPGTRPRKRWWEKACRELALLVEPVARALHMEDGVLALTGSILLRDKAVREVRRRCFGCDFRACGWRNPKATPPQAQRFWRWKH
ncbi:MAG: BadF/BadG/BcrA/BcrD ATPase family protein [Ruthenibacterium lactatiformans]